MKLNTLWKRIFVIDDLDNIAPVYETEGPYIILGDNKEVKTESSAINNRVTVPTFEFEDDSNDISNQEFDKLVLKAIIESQKVHNKIFKTKDEAADYFKEIDIPSYSMWLDDNSFSEFIPKGYVYYFSQPECFGVICKQSNKYGLLIVNPKAICIWDKNR